MKMSLMQSITSNKTMSGFALATLLAASPVIAAEKPEISNTTAAKSATIFTVATIVGGVAGGPVGFILGALSGAYLGEQNKNHELDQKALASAESKVSTLRQQNAIQEKRISRLEKSAATPLEFLVLFPTGEDTLSHSDTQRLASLANYMKDNPQLRVRLDGHADPRGTDEYNSVLSEERAKSVVSALTKRGIPENRIDYYAHGADLSNATAGDLEAYALERKVRIEVYTNANGQEVAVK